MGLANHPPGGALLAVLDAIAIVTGNRHPRKAWERLRAARPEAARDCRTPANPRGKPSIYAPPEHILCLLSFLPGKRTGDFFSTFLKVMLRQARIKITVTPGSVTVECQRPPAASDENAPEEPQAPDEGREADQE